MTAFINSEIQSIANLRFNPLPLKPQKMLAAVRVPKGSGNVYVFVDAKGNIYSTEVRDRMSYSPMSNMEATLTGCMRLGLLSASAVREHESLRKTEQCRRDKKFAASQIDEHAQILGLVLTKAQRAKIKAAAQERDI